MEPVLENIFLRVFSHSYSSRHYYRARKTVAIQNDCVDFVVDFITGFRGRFLPGFRTGIPKAEIIFEKGNQKPRKNQEPFNQTTSRN
jgi:hypothetical protein